MIKAICIDDKSRPKEIPEADWVKAGEVYHIIYIYNMMKQNNILGCSLKEKPLSEEKHFPFNAFRLSRFAIKENDMAALIELAKGCDELNDLDLNELIEEQILIEN